MNRPSAATTFRWLATIAALSAVLWALGHFSRPYIQPFAHWVKALGPRGPVAFIATYTLAEVFLIPASALTLVAGALFGFVAGSVYAFVGAMLGSVAAFAMGRYVVRPVVHRRLHGDRRFEIIDGAATTGGVRVVALLRLSPLLPYTVLNYALGITRISWWAYLVGTLFIVPGTLVYTYYGTVIATVTGITPSVPHGVAFYALMAVGVLATIAVIVIIGRLANRELIKSTEPTRHD